MLISCQKPISNYEIKNVISPKDWNKKIAVEKNILIKSIFSDYLSNDSMEFNIYIDSIKNFKKIPDPDKLKSIIYSFLLDCKYQCKNQATFRPTSLDIYFVDSIPPHEPTQIELDDFESTFKTYQPDIYKNDTKFYESEKKEMYKTARKGNYTHMNLFLNFRASNSYGTPGELKGSGEIRNGKYKFIIAYEL
jgi:hypothetical protein